MSHRATHPRFLPFLHGAAAEVVVFGGEAQMLVLQIIDFALARQLKQFFLQTIANEDQDEVLAMVRGKLQAEGLRTYLFAHTTNRIDVELGARGVRG